jgi:hypothetical protein
MTHFGCIACARTYAREGIDGPPTLEALLRPNILYEDCFIDGVLETPQTANVSSPSGILLSVSGDRTPSSDEGPLQPSTALLLSTTCNRSAVSRC